jgi:hypothetical protein
MEVRKDNKIEEKDGDILWKRKLIPSSHNITSCFDDYLKDVVQFLSDSIKNPLFLLF